MSSNGNIKSGQSRGIDRTWQWDHSYFSKNTVCEMCIPTPPTEIGPVQLDQNRPGKPSRTGGVPTSKGPDSWGSVSQESSDQHRRLMQAHSLRVSSITTSIQIWSGVSIEVELVNPCQRSKAFQTGPSHFITSKALCKCSVKWM